jgi:hypothetical protein
MGSGIGEIGEDGIKSRGLSFLETERLRKRGSVGRPMRLLQYLSYKIPSGSVNWISKTRGSVSMYLLGDIRHRL